MTPTPIDGRAHVTIARPAASEHAPYYGTYIQKVPDGDVLALLAGQVEDTIAVLNGLSETQALFRYAADKWSIKQVVGHLSDTERIFVYRALAFARREAQSLPGFDENAYVATADLDRRTLGGLLGELRAVRAATVAFFAGLNEDELSRVGTANGNAFTVRAIAWIICGHERHHDAIIRERYLAAIDRR